MTLLRKIAPPFVHKIWNRCRELITIAKQKKMHKLALRRLKDKKVINCVFFALFEETWKYEYVYRLMEKNPRFNPIVLVCPIVNYGRENMINRMERCFCAFKEKGYRVVRAWDESTDSYLDVRKTLNPDIIFYTNPYKSIIDSRYYISNFRDLLTVYVPYFVNGNNDYRLSCNLEMHNLVWRRYTETDYHTQLSIDHALNKGINAVTTGYPGIEAYLQIKRKKVTSNKKCIIWAPHHTIEPVGIIYYSCFLRYSDFMLELARKFKESVHFVFKPHPLLRNKLNAKWGKEKTDAYYQLWADMENTSLNEGAYEDLFIESDGMIHDSASFIAEYLYLNKPVMRTLNEEDLNKLYNSFGLQCIDNHYLAYSEQDIEEFVRNIVNGEDPMLQQRSQFVNNVLLPKGSPSQNIIDDILDSIDNQILYRN